MHITAVERATDDYNRERPHQALKYWTSSEVHSEGPGVNAIRSLMGQPMEGSLRSHSTRRHGNSGPAIADHIRLHNPLSYGSRKAIPLPNGKNKSGASAYDPKSRNKRSTDLTTC
jgi:hypothetical protein